jgi:glycosyltransferase involved in cell wall biosynthesis
MSKNSSDFNGQLASSNKPLVSIIMNCYNGDQYLREALDSVVAQTYGNWELIFWDNQSTDNSSTILKNYKDKRFRYFSAPKHTELGKARRLAIHQSLGEWVAILDVDDIWISCKLEAQFALLKSFSKKEKVSLIYGRTNVFSETLQHSTKQQKVVDLNLFEKLINGNFIVCSSVLFRKSTYDELGGFSPQYDHAYDYDLLLKIVNEHEVLYVDKVIVRYRIHKNNLSKCQTEISVLEDYRIVSQYFPDSRACHRMKTIIIDYIILLIRTGQYAKIVKIFPIIPFFHLFFYVFIKLVTRITSIPQNLLTKKGDK